MQFNRIFTLVVALAVALTSWSVMAETVVTVNRYAGMPDFMRSRQTMWLKQEGRYLQIETPELSNDSTCTTLLNQHQQFSLAQMIFRGYLKDDSNARFYMNLLSSYHPSQVSFLQLSHTDQPRAKGALPNAHVVEKALIDLEPAVHATLSVVSGHYLRENGKQIATTPLPWQLEESLKPLAMKLDRNRYRFVSEWGRAGQVVPKDMDELMITAALLQLEELHAMGANIADGWVTFHSLDRVHTVAYKRRFRDSMFGEENPETGEAVFLIPLATVFEVLHAEKGNKILQALMGQGLDIDRAAYLMQFFRRAEHSEYTAVNRHSQKAHAHPVIVTDLSDLQPEVIRAHLKGIGTPEAIIDPIHHILNTSRPYSYSLNHPRALDYALTPMVREHLAEENTILLTNLDPSVAKDDPYYVETMMYSVLKSKFTMLKDYDPEWTFEEFSRLMIEREIRFAVYTTDEEIKSQLTHVFAQPRYQEVRVTNPRALTALEQGELVRLGGFEALLKPRTEIQYRFSFSMKDLLNDMRIVLRRKSWFEAPEYLLDYRQFAIEHALMGASGLQ